MEESGGAKSSDDKSTGPWFPKDSFWVDVMVGCGRSHGTDLIFDF